MLELTSLDINYAVRELQRLQGAKVEKVFQSEQKRDVLFCLYLRDAPKVNLRFLLPGFLCTTVEKPEYPQLPPGFAMFLRKYLAGTRLQSISQRGFDRIIMMEFASKVDTFSLVVEFIPPGNMLLLDKEGRIINLLENQQFKDRTLRGKQMYIAPPPSYDTTTVSDEELDNRIIASTNNSIVTTLAINCCLGGVYAEEVCVRAGIQKNRNDLSTKEVRMIVKALRELFTQPIAAHKDERRPYPFQMMSKKLTPCEETSFLSTLSSFVHDDLMLEKTEKAAKTKASPATKLQAIIDAQRAQVTRFEQEAVLEQRKGERIFEEYQLLQEIMTTVRDARTKKEDIIAALKTYPQVKAYAADTGELTLEIEDEIVQ